MTMFFKIYKSKNNLRQKLWRWCRWASHAAKAWNHGQIRHPATSTCISSPRVNEGGPIFRCL